MCRKYCLDQKCLLLFGVLREAKRMQSCISSLSQIRIRGQFSFLKKYGITKKKQKKTNNCNVTLCFDLILW